jgi:N-acetylneuraminic acid mutarotase
MESTKVEQLLEAYFDANTTLEEEKALKDYFKSGDVEDHLKVYQSLFIGLGNAKNEVLQKELQLPQKKTISSNWWYGIAATVAVMFVVAGTMFSDSGLSQEEKEALAAFDKSKEAMIMLSESFNKGTEELAVLDHFTIAKNKVLK